MMNEPENAPHGAAQDNQSATGAGNETALPKQDTTNQRQAEPAPSEQPTTKLFTQEEVDRIVSERLKRGVKSELKKLLEGDGFESIDDVKAKLKETETALRRFQQAETVQTVLSKSKIDYRQDSFLAIKELVLNKLQDQETVTEKDIERAIAELKTIAPALFEVAKPARIDAGASQNSQNVTDMNSIIRNAIKRK